MGEGPPRPPAQPPVDPGLLARTRGFLEAAEGEHLFRLADEAARQGPCLEIGSYCGKSTLYLGAACRERGQVLFCVDHHRGSEEQQPGEEYFDPALFSPAEGAIDTFPHFRRTVAAAGLLDTVVPIVCRSELAARAWRTPLGLVFIDGGHAYDTVLADFRAWSAHLVPGGLLAFHDVFPDPAQGGQAPFRVYGGALVSGLFAEHSFIGSLGVLRRKAV
jgi:predicted O-methyltransferase YrrM